MKTNLEDFLPVWNIIYFRRRSLSHLLTNLWCVLTSKTFRHSNLWSTMFSAHCPICPISHRLVTLVAIIYFCGKYIYIAKPNCSISVLEQVFSLQSTPALSNPQGINVRDSGSTSIVLFTGTTYVTYYRDTTCLLICTEKKARPKVS